MGNDECKMNWGVSSSRPPKVGWRRVNYLRLFRVGQYASLITLYAILITLSGCYTSRTNDYLLYTNTIRGNRTVISDELEALIPQKPNRRILRTPLTPALWIYQASSRRYNRDSAIAELAAKTTQFERQSELVASDPRALRRLNRRFSREARKLRRYAEEGNWWMRNLGEKPTYFYPRDAEANALKMQTYLRRTKGFLRATAEYTVDTLLDGRVRVNYLIDEKEPYRLRSISYDIPDSNVRALVQAERGKSYLKIGDRFDGDKLDNERTRIEELLRNNGYYEFGRNYIRVSASRDTAAAVVATNDQSTLVDLTIQIPNPPLRNAHPLYQIGDVNVRIGSTQESTATSPTTPTDTISQNGILYFYSGRKFATRLLDSKIRLRPGKLYSQNDYTSTQRQLFLLNQFKFVNINFTDTTGRRLRTEIRATPLDKYEITTEGGLFVLYQGQGYPGPFANLTFRIRNFFGGLETFETNLRAGIEAQTGFADSTSTSQLRDTYLAQELGLTTSLIFPQILFPGRLRFAFNDLNPRTQISLGYNYTNRPDFLRQTFRTTLSYNWQKAPRHQYSFFLTDLNLIRSSFRGGPNEELRKQFEQRLIQLRDAGNRVLFNSFLPSIASNMSFAYTYNTNVFGENRRANFFRVALESGGTTLNLLSSAAIRRFTEQTGLQLFKYLRFNADFRHYIPLRPRTTLAFRVNSGLLYSYGPDRSAPYEKYFFAGGSNSLRAWRPRRLGPGSAYPRSTESKVIPGVQVPTFITDPRNPEVKLPQFDYTFEQPGDFLLEGSAELRWRYFHFGADINGALFLDAGNVWTLRNDPARPNAELRVGKLVPDIAVGTGTGVRIDFSYFIIRFDAGIKVWDPARRYIRESDGQLIDERFLLPQFTLKRLSRGANPLIVNFGIGYPF